MYVRLQLVDEIQVFIFEINAFHHVTLLLDFTFAISNHVQLKPLTAFLPDWTKNIECTHDLH